ncbi:MAG: helix-turn-helix domain-containing protein [Rhodospirillaceae bacterium]
MHPAPQTLLDSIGVTNPRARIEAISRHKLKIEGRVRELEAKLKTMEHFLQLTARQQCLAIRILAKEAPDDTSAIVQIILAEVAQWFDIDVDKLRGGFRGSRRAIYAQPRQIAMYLARRITTGSLSDIGTLVGRLDRPFDHGTVLHNCRAVEDRIEINDLPTMQAINYLEPRISQVVEQYMKARNE